MNNKNTLSSVLYIILFLCLFVVLQYIGQLLAMGSYSVIKDVPFTTVSEHITGEVQSFSYVFGSVLTFLVFVRTKWTTVSRTYLKSRPWGVLTWAFLLSLGLILPTEFLAEKLHLVLPEQTQQLFESIMKTPWGYVALGIMAPIAEELVFRGAILRRLLDLFGERSHWWAIGVSALIFGVIHFNIAQGVHAFLVGLLLGWMYYRTRSIIPGILVHWVNNSVAYLMFNLMPQMNDGKLIDLFHGDTKVMYGGLFFSLCIFLPSLFQLALRMHKADK